VVDHVALSLEQDVEALIAEPAALMDDCVSLCSF